MIPAERLRRFLLAANRNPLIVVIIGLVLLWVWGVVNPRSPSGTPGMRLSATGAQMKTFDTVLRAFESDLGRYPSQAEGLEALVVCPRNIAATNWHGPYLERIPFDPWSNAYIYRYPGIHNTKSFDLYSRGPDRISRTDGEDKDDMQNWEVTRPPWERISPTEKLWVYARPLILVAAVVLLWREILARRHRA